MGRVIMMCVTVLTLGACASVPPSSVYLSQMRQAHPADIASIASGDVAAPLLKPGVNKFDVGAGDRVLELSHYSSYYKLLRVGQARPLKVTINSYCSCLGYDKRVMMPVVYGLSVTGQVVDAHPGTYALHQATGLTSPLHISLETDFANANVAYVVVA